MSDERESFADQGAPAAPDAPDAKGAPVRRWQPGGGIATKPAQGNNDQDNDNQDHNNSNTGERPDMTGPTGQREIGGRDGPDPTRFGDWEIKGRCIDF